MLMCPICHASQINDRASFCWNCKNQIGFLPLQMSEQTIPHTNNEILTEIRTLLEKIKILLEKADG